VYAKVGMMNTLPPLPPGLLLDLDDTILTYDAIGREMWRQTSEVFADRCDTDAPTLNRALDEMRHWYWSDPERNQAGRMCLDQTRLEITHLALQRLGADDRELAAELAEHFRQHRDAAISFFPGARETLDELARRGHRLALVTNGQSHHQRAKLDHFDLERYFEVICVEGEMGFGKPDRRAFETALAGLGLPPEETWMVGDNLEWDIRGAQAVGICGVWHDYRRRGLPEGSAIIPDHTIHALSDLLA
jgi:HAD superfamily hydrolase (TIGR01549 family)